MSVEAFHWSSRVTKLFALSAGARSSLMKVITQVKLLVTGLLNRMVGRVVTLTQWMLIAAVTDLDFSFIQCSAEVDGARRAMALAKDANRNEFWLGYLPPAWIPKAAAKVGFLAQNTIVLLCAFSVLLSTLSLFRGDLACKQNEYRVLIQLVQARFVGSSWCLRLVSGHSGMIIPRHSAPTATGLTGMPR